MLAALAPALPGGNWTDSEAGVGFGFRRLPAGSGVDALHVDHEANLAVVADVRLDDREGLCDALGMRPSERAGLADSELVLRGYRRWGRDLPNRLLGDYAFAVLDARKRILFCARDPAGVKPCYYAANKSGVAFASTLDAVLAAPGVSSELDEDIVARSLTCHSFFSTDRTFFKDVRKLPPGHSLTLAIDASPSPAVPRLERYWKPEQAPAVRRSSDDAYAEEFLSLYTQAIAARLGGPDPIGTHLSGGLDSSGIAVLAARELRRQNRPAPLAFSWLPDLGGRLRPWPGGRRRPAPSVCGCRAAAGAPKRAAVVAAAVARGGSQPRGFQRRTLVAALAGPPGSGPAHRRQAKAWTAPLQHAPSVVVGTAQRRHCGTH